MTETQAGTYRKIRASQILFGLFALFCLMLILRNSDTAIEYMTRGLLLCARTVIPSLFPFMVLSELLVSGGFANRLFSRLSRPIKFLFRLPSVGGCAVLLGVLCGFPVGARCAVLAYDAGMLTRRQCETVLIAASTPSSAFLISAVGASLWGNRAFGVALYGCTVAASLLTGILFGHFRIPHGTLPSEKPTSDTPSLGGARLFTASIRSATESILQVCAYVVFFSALTGTLNLVLSRFEAPSLVGVLLTAFFELSSGVSGAIGFSHGIPGALLGAAAVGWSGLSVHCQLLSLCDGRGLSMKPYIFAKLLQALLCTLMMALLLYCFPSLLTAARPCAAVADWLYLL